MPLLSTPSKRARAASPALFCGCQLLLQAGHHGLEPLIVRAQRVHVNLQQKRERGGHAAGEQAKDLDKFDIFVLERQSIDYWRHFLAGAAPACGEVHAHEVLVFNKHLPKTLNRAETRCNGSRMLLLECTHRVVKLLN